MPKTGDYLAAARRAQHLTPQQLAALAGYSNLAKGGNRILDLERDGVTVPGLLDKVVAALGLDGDHVRVLMDADRRDFQDAWERWADEPIAPELRVRMIPAVWGREALPPGLSRDEAVAYASRRAVERQQTYVLVWSRRQEVWAYPSGRLYERPVGVGESAGPFTRLRGRGERGFVFG